MKILFTTPILEHPPAGGPQLRIENSIKALNQISELYVLSRVTRESIGGYSAENYFRSICYKFDYLPSAQDRFKGNFIKILKYRINTNYFLLNKLLNLPFKTLYKLYMSLNNKHVDYFYQDINFIIDYIDKYNINIIWFGYGNISYELMRVLKNQLPKIKMVCDTDSVWSRYILRELDVEKDPFRRDSIKNDGDIKISEEKNWVEFMDITTAVSEVDADYYRSINLNKKKIHLFSNVIDIDTYLKPIDPPDIFNKPNIYLAGSFGYGNSPMDWAAKWMIEEVYPILKKAIPEITFYIIGGNSERLKSQISDDSIKVIGRVDSVLPYLCNADVSLVPLQFESGTRFKILEAAACGIPIVSTTLGAEGIPVSDGEEILIANTPNEFSDAIIKLIQDKHLAKKISQNCKKLIEEKYSVKSLAKEGQKIIKYLQQNN